MASSSQALELGRFLRSRRERLTPAQVGLPTGTRRRAPGLRREEVALLADVSPSYYTHLEQGLGARPSAAVVDSLARTLQLSGAERRHLDALAREPAVSDLEGGGGSLPAAVVHLVGRLSPAPAFVKGPRWDVVVANDAARELFAGWGETGESVPNVLRWMFCSPSAREVHTNWADEARALLARFRRDVAGRQADIEVSELLGEVLDASPDARAWWPSEDVAEPTSGTKALHHPAVGAVTLEHAALLVAEQPDHRLVIYADPGHGDERFTAMLAHPR